MDSNDMRKEHPENVREAAACPSCNAVAGRYCPACGVLLVGECPGCGVSLGEMAKALCSTGGEPAHVDTGRNGAYSEAKAGPMLIVPEPTQLRAIPTDQGAQLRWDYDPRVEEISIWRKLGGERPSAPGDGLKLDTGRVDGFSDSKLKNNVEYWYYVVACYRVDGKRVCSRGSSCSVIPHKYQAPVEQLLVVKSDGGPEEYMASWQSAEKSEILLLASDSEPACRTGEIVPVEELLTRHKLLEVDRWGEGTAYFSCRFGGGAYILAAAVSGKYACVSRPCYITNVKDVRDPAYQKLGNDLHIRMAWAEGISQVVLVYRMDRYPKAPDEPGAALLRVTKKQYDSAGAAVLREAEEAVYYVRIYSVFRTPQGNSVYSGGVRLRADNAAKQEIFYQLEYKKKRIAKRNLLTVTLSSFDSFVLPTIVLTGKVGRIPLRKTDGIPLFHSKKELSVDGQITLRFKAVQLPERLYIRLFLQNDDGYDQFRLLALNAKIT